MKIKNLPINTKPPVSFFLHHVLPLCMILADGKNQNFLHANYIQLYKSPKNKYIFDIYPRIGSAELYGSFPIDNVLSNQILSGNVVPLRSDQYIENIIKWINQEYYVNVYLAEQYIENSPFYETGEHKNHQCFITGYNLDAETFQVFNFDQAQNLTQYDVKFESLLRGMAAEELKKDLEVKGYKDYLIQLKRPNNAVIQYNYTDSKTIALIKDRLDEFVNCTDSSQRNFLSYDMTENCEWGLDVYPYFEKSIHQEYPIDFLFQGICGIVEHKEVMKMRFEYLISQGIDIRAELSRYEAIVKYFNKLKFRGLYCLEKQNFKKICTYVHETPISKIANEEREIVDAILRKMK